MTADSEDVTVEETNQGQTQSGSDRTSESESAANAEGAHDSCIREAVPVQKKSFPCASVSSADDKAALRH